MTPKGYFDGPEEALHLVHHRDTQTGGFISPEKSMRYYWPEKAAEAFAG